jgi:type VI secretion system protein ImpB
MANDGTVAPKERINIKYVPATGDQQAEIELPLRMMVVGDFKGHTEETLLEERQAVSINKTNFNAVMQEAELKLQVTVDDHLSETSDPDASLTSELSFNTLDDFSPDKLAKQVPELNKLLELREALVALKGPLGNVPAFRKKLQSLLENAETREKLASEIGLVLSEKPD